jgi:hypothetical protein
MERLYHVFTHRKDAWFQAAEYEPALDLFTEWAQENGNARLYEEVWESLDAEDAASEDCLLAYGPFPG